MSGTDVEAVLFDLDGTICDYRRSNEEVLELAFDTVGVDPYFTAEEYIETLDRLPVQHSSFDKHRESCFVELSKRADRDPDLGRAVARVYAEERDQTNVSFCPAADRVLSVLGERYPLGLVTNGGPDIQLQKLNALDILDRFETIVYAGFDTPAKPDPTPFEYALDAIGASSARSVYIGNSLTADVTGARAAGLTSVWISDGTDPDPVPDIAVESLTDLLEFPWRNQHNAGDH